jgi:cytochrome P450
MFSKDGGVMLGVPDPLFQAEVIEDPYDYYAALRDDDPVHRVEGTNAFVVSRGQLIQQVVADPSDLLQPKRCLPLSRPWRTARTPTSQWP